MNTHFRIAITGGIGSGKSYVCSKLAERGIKVYDCDAAAKRIMTNDHTLQTKLSEVIGEDVVKDGVLQKPVLAKFLLASDDNKNIINDIVHPAVAADFMSSGYHWLESAILFESNFDKRVDFDLTVCVIAPEDVRIERIAKRDNISIEQAAQWLKSQMPQDEMAKKADFIIVNNGKSDLSTAIMSLLEAASTLGNKNK